MNSYHITLFEGHAIIYVEDNIILIDTGSPSTIHSEKSIEFNRRSFNTSTNLLGVTTEHISDLLGMTITTLMGTDILSQFVVQFDYQNNTIIFDPEQNPRTSKTVTLPFTTILGVPSISISVDSNPITAFLDSGAKLSYLTNKVTESHKMEGIVEDFHPSIGRFETPTYRIHTSVGGLDLLVLYGNLPSTLSSLLSMQSIDGIIGFDLFMSFVITMDFKQELLYLKHIVI
jgi:hypothetical protein